MNNIFQPKNSLVLGIAVIVLAILITIILATARPRPEPAPPVTPPLAEVSIVLAQPETHAPMVTTTARVDAKHDINIVSRVSGIIESTETAFSRGQRVAEGELLLTIDDLDYVTALAQSQSNLANAEQSLATEKGSARQAQREWRELGNQEANDLFLRRPQIKAAEASLEAAKADVRQAEENLNRTKIRAPFTGQITDIKANLGQYITAGTQIARLVSVGHLEIAVPLTVGEVTRLGFQRGDDRYGDIERDVEIIYTAGFQKVGKTTGRLLRIDSVIDEDAQVGFAIIEIQDENTPIRTGELVRVNIPGNAFPDSMWLPESALYQRDQLMTVEDGRLSPMKIELLDLRDGKILVTGVQAGTEIVIKRPIWTAAGTEVATNLEPGESSTVQLSEQPDSGAVTEE